MPPHSSSTSSRSPNSHRNRRSTEINEAEFGTPASLPRKNLHGISIPAPPIGRHSFDVVPRTLLRTIATNADVTLSSVDFSNRVLNNNDSLLPLLTALETNTTVTSLNLSSCKLTDSSCQPIAELLYKNTALTSLHLDNNEIGVEGAAALSTALITNDILKSITLNGNPLGDRGLIYLAKACGHNSTLHTLELEGCGITQRGRVDQLQSLLLKRRIDSNFESLLERLQDDDYRVTGIDLSGRPLGDGGVIRLAEALADNTQVRQLWLRDCSVSNVGAKALGSCLEQNMSIVDLFLGGNDVTDEGLKYISDALRGSNATLVSVEMDDNRISARGVQDFMSALGKNTSVLVATFENNMEDGEKCLGELQKLLEDRRKGMNLVSFVVDPEEEDDDDDKSAGLVNMSVCSSYMPSTYRRAGFRSVASTKYSKQSPSLAGHNMFRTSTGSGQSLGSHVFSIYNKTSRQGSLNRQTPPPNNVSAAAVAVAVHQHSYSPAPAPPPFAPVPPRHSPPQALVSPPQAVHSPVENHSTKSDRSSKRSSITRPPPPPARNASVLQPPTQPQGSTAQPHHLVIRRSSSGSTSRSKRSPQSNDPPGSRSHALTLHQSSTAHQSLVKVDSISHSSSQKSSSKHSKTSSAKNNEMQLTHHIAAMKVIEEADEETDISLPSSHYTETAENYDKSFKSVCRRVEMMRLMNYFTAIHYRSRHFWLWFTPISLCIFLAGILSLASAVGGDAALIMSLVTAFFALTAFVLNFLQARFGWSSLAQSHKSASLELAKVGKKLEELQEYEGALSSRSVSSRSRADAVRDVYRIDVYLTAMQKCTPDIPMPIDQAFRLLVQRMDHFGKKYPNAIKARLQEYDEDYFDPDDPIPLEMQLDAFDLLCQNIRQYAGFPMFLPKPQNMVGMTTNSFFAKGRGPPPKRRGSSRSYDSRSRDASSRGSRSSYSRRSSGDSYSRSSYGSSGFSYDSRTRTTRTGTSMYTDDMYTEESRVV